MSYRDDSSSASRDGGPGGGGGSRGGGGGGNGGGGSNSGSRGGFDNNQGAWNGNGRSLGLKTGKDWYGNTAYGPAGGNVQAYGMRDAASLRNAGMGPSMGSFGNFRTPSGQAMFGGSPIQGQSYYGMNMGQGLSQAQRAYNAWNNPHVAQGPLDRPTHRGPTVSPVSDVPPQYMPQLPGMYYPPSMPSVPYVSGSMAPWYGQSAIPPNPAVYSPPVKTPPAGTYTPSYRTPGSWPGQNTYYRNHQTGKTYMNDRVPQEDGWAQSNSYNGRSGG